MELQRDNHLEYLTKGLKRLDPSFCVLDAKYLSISLAYMRIFIITNLNGVHCELILNYVTLCLIKVIFSFNFGAMLEKKKKKKVTDTNHVHCQSQVPKLFVVKNR